MPGMVRPKNKGTSIAFAILGVPENLIHEEAYKGYKNLRQRHENKQYKLVESNTDTRVNNGNMYYDDVTNQRY